MIKLLTGGGLGDAALSLAKLYSKDLPFKLELGNTKITHITNVKGKGTHDISIPEFYKSQGINSEVILAPTGPDLKNKIRPEYAYYLGTGWDELNGGDERSWKIEPFPPLVYENMKADIVISPFAAWDLSRTVTSKEMKEFVSKIPQDRNITYVGKVPNEMVSLFEEFRGESFLNQVGVKHLIDFVCSANTIVAHVGFISILGGLANKKVLTFGNHGANRRDLYHPEWNMKCNKRLNDISMGDL
jgi:hypothetical protein